MLLSRAYRVEFTFGMAASQPDYVDVELKVREPLLGTANYRGAID